MGILTPARRMSTNWRERVMTVLSVVAQTDTSCGPLRRARVPQLKLWTVSGEYLSVDLAERFCSAFPEARLLNLYGSSEVAGDVTCYEVGEVAGLNAIPVGKPISNIQLYILDEFLESVPIGVPGTLYVGGDCLAQGYWSRPDLTSEHFITNPFGVGRGPIFATGDRARWLSDGNIESSAWYRPDPGSRRCATGISMSFSKPRGTAW
jgi:non-ribosomal peptide synthetase component F